MKNTTKLILSLAALFAAGFSQNAAAWGAYIPVSGTSFPFGARLIAVAEYATEDDARDALHTACIAAFDPDSNCVRSEFTTFQDGVVLIGAPDFSATAEDGATYEAAIVKAGLAIASESVARTFFGANTATSTDRIVCADGTGNANLMTESIPENCTMEASPPTSRADCTDAAMPYFDDKGTPDDSDNVCRAYEDGECPDELPVFDDKTQAAIDAGNCRVPNTIAECRDQIGSFNSLYPEGHWYADSDETSGCRLAESHTECRDIFNAIATGGQFFDMENSFRCRSVQSSAECGILITAGTVLGGNTYHNSDNGTCVVPSANAHCIDVDATKPIFDDNGTPDNSNDDTCRLPENIAECNTLNPNKQFFDDRGTTSDASDDECRKPKMDSECIAIDAGLVPPRTGTTDAQPINDDNELDGCRPVQEDKDCTTTGHIFSTPGDPSGMCRFPMDNRECDRLDSDKPIFDDSMEAGLSDPKCRVRGPNDCPEGQIVGDDGNCGLPQNDKHCDTLYGNDMPIHDTREPDNCRPRNANDCTDAASPVLINGVCSAAMQASHCPPPSFPQNEVYDTNATATGNCRPLQATDCAATGEVFSGGNCIAPSVFLETGGITLTTAGATYTASECTGAEWTASVAVSDDNSNAAEVCLIPVMRDNTVSISIVQTALRGDLQPQLANNAMANGCIMRASGTFDTFPFADYSANANIGANTEFCNAVELFGEGGFPSRPPDFDETRDQIIISGTEVLARVDGVIVAVNRVLPSAPSGGSGTAKDGAQVAGIVGGVLGFAAIVHYFHTEGAGGGFAFSPTGGYSFSESGYSARFGGRAEYEMGGWDLYWTANQTNADGDFGVFRYASGGEYKTDFWKAAFSESVSGKTADYDLSLSAEWTGGIWKLSPTYRIHSRFDETDSGILESETRNSLNLESELLWNRWQIKPSAGFSWQNERDFADNAKFRINAVHRF